MSKTCQYVVRLSVHVQLGYTKMTAECDRLDNWNLNVDSWVFQYKRCMSEFHKLKWLVNFTNLQMQHASSLGTLSKLCALLVLEISSSLHCLHPKLHCGKYYSAHFLILLQGPSHFNHLKIHCALWCDLNLKKCLFTVDVSHIDFL